MTKTKKLTITILAALLVLSFAAGAFVLMTDLRADREAKLNDIAEHIGEVEEGH